MLKTLSRLVAHHRVPVDLAQLLEHCVARDAGVVHQDVDGADLGQRGGTALGVGDVGAHVAEVEALGLAGSHPFGALGLVEDVGGPHLVAGGGESLADGGPDATGATGDDSDSLAHADLLGCCLGGSSAGRVSGRSAFDGQSDAHATADAQRGETLPRHRGAASRAAA
jgi:hypothetical protein